MSYADDDAEQDAYDALQLMHHTRRSEANGDILAALARKGHAAGVAEERERVAVRSWPGVEGYDLDDCTVCPFGNYDNITEKKPRGACDAGFTTCRPFTEDEGRADGPPAWCALRGGGIYVALEILKEPHDDG